MLEPDDPLRDAIAAQEAALDRDAPVPTGSPDPGTVAALYDLMDGETYRVELADLGDAERALNAKADDSGPGRADGNA